jgi:hypothetical protein
VGRVVAEPEHTLSAVRGVAEHRVGRAALLELRPDGGTACSIGTDMPRAVAGALVAAAELNASTEVLDKAATR